MTTVRENATICGECEAEVRAWRRGQLEQWVIDFTDVHGREPTEREVMENGPRKTMLGPEGYPECIHCHGVGAYMDDGTTAVWSRTMLPGAPPITQAAIP